MTNKVPDNIFTVPELPPERRSIDWLFGAILALGLVNLCCTPFYLMTIAWLAARVMGE